MTTTIDVDKLDAWMSEVDERLDDLAKKVGELTRRVKALEELAKRSQLTHGSIK